MEFLHVFSLQTEILGGQRIEGGLRWFKTIADVDRPEFFVGGNSHPSRPMWIPQGHDAIATGRPLIFADVIEELSAAVAPNRPTPLQSIFFQP